MVQYDYDPFGNIIEQTGDVNNSITYAGYQYDAETDLYYLNARYYDSKIARFISEDTYKGDPNDPLSLNLYTYCHNEPIMYSDPTGHKEILDVFIDRDSEVGKTTLQTIKEATDEWNRLNARLSKIKDKNSVEYKEISTQMSNQELKANLARLVYAIVSGDEKYINLKYGELIKHKSTNSIQTSNNSNSTGNDWSLEDFFYTLEDSSNALMINDPIPSIGALGPYEYVTYLDTFGGAVGKIVAKGGLLILSFGDDATKFVINKSDDAVNFFCKVLNLSDDTKRTIKGAMNLIDDASEYVDETVPVGCKITGYTKHGLNQAIGRDGGCGVSSKAILDSINNPIKIVVQDGKYGKTYKYIGKLAVVVLNEAGEVVTTYAKGRGGLRNLSTAILK